MCATNGSACSMHATALQGALRAPVAQRMRSLCWAWLSIGFSLTLRLCTYFNASAPALPQAEINAVGESVHFYEPERRPTCNQKICVNADHFYNWAQRTAPRELSLSIPYTLVWTAREAFTRNGNDEAPKWKYLVFRRVSVNFASRISVFKFQ